VTFSGTGVTWNVRHSSDAGHTLALPLAN